MWLLDVNMPQPLVQLLGGLGIKAETAISQDWGTLSNGSLVAAAIEQGFTCLLTRDRLFGDSAAKALKTHPQFAVVLVTLPQVKAPAFLEIFKTSWKTSPIQPRPGKMTSWPK